MFALNRGLIVAAEDCLISLRTADFGHPKVAVTYVDSSHPPH